VKFDVQDDQNRPIVPCMFTFGSTEIPNAMALLTVKCLVASEDGCECGAEIGVRILQSSKPFYSRSFTPIDASFAVFLVYDARLAPIINSSSV
jgi:hypothetical protein